MGDARNANCWVCVCSCATLLPCRKNRQNRATAQAVTNKRKTRKPVILPTSNEGKGGAGLSMSQDENKYQPRYLPDEDKSSYENGKYEGKHYAEDTKQDYEDLYNG